MVERPFIPKENHMTTETATRLGKDIVQDLNSNRYYAMPGELAKYIGNVLAINEQDAASTADAILSDWNGAGYYKDAEILAQFLEGRSGK